MSTPPDLYDAAAIWPIAEATVDVALGDLSAEERRQLTRLMARVKSKLQAMAERDPAPASAGEEATDEEAHAL